MGKNPFAKMPPEAAPFMGPAKKKVPKMAAEPAGDNDMAFAKTIAKIGKKGAKKGK